MLLILTAASFSQQNNPSTSLTKQDYLLKSKKQANTALILLGGGAALVGTGIIFPKGEYEGTSFIWGIDTYSNDSFVGVLLATGSLSMLGSIPFFIASGKNNRKAMNVSFKNEMTPQLSKRSFVYKPVPSLTLKISL